MKSRKAPVSGLDFIGMNQVRGVKRGVPALLPRSDGRGVDSVDRALSRGVVIELMVLRADVTILPSVSRGVAFISLSSSSSGAVCGIGAAIFSAS